LKENSPKTMTFAIIDLPPTYVPVLNGKISWIKFGKTKWF